MQKLLGSLIAAIAALLLAAPLAAADTYTVTRTDDPVPGACLPDDCSLREALLASNATTTVDDLVVVPAAPAVYRVDYEMLTLSVTDQVEVRGDGADRSVIEGDGKSVLVSVGSPGVLFTGVTIKGGAGGFQNNGGLTLRGVSVENNKRDGAGGGIQNNGPVVIESSYFALNSTPGVSGGAIQSNGPVTVINSTFTRNSSNSASAILGNGAVTISSSTFAFNESTGTTAPAVGGKPLTVRDNVFTANKHTAGLLNCGSLEPILSLGGNVGDDASCGTTATDRPNVDPLLGTLALHGGKTPLYDLLPGSPAIDAAGQCPPFDQRGVARPLGAACDSGAYEFVPTVVPPPPPVDGKVELRLGKGKLTLTQKGKVVVRVTCLPTEVSSPCHGKVLLKTRKGAQLASAKFKVAAAKTKKVALKLPAAKADLVRSTADARKAQVLVRARDGAGNLLLLNKPRKIVVG
jgi:hypothetical protein